ncbi:MAG: hypothetical protein ACLVJH_14935 [Faecalibacterium prausnitzii]
MIIAKEQGIIGQEIKMYDDSPDWRLITGLFECLYHSHPIRSDIAGTVESIAEITPAMLYDSCKAFMPRAIWCWLRPATPLWNRFLPPASGTA